MNETLTRWYHVCNTAEGIASAKLMGTISPGLTAAACINDGECLQWRRARCSPVTALIRTSNKANIEVFCGLNIAIVLPRG